MDKETLEALVREIGQTIYSKTFEHTLNEFLLAGKSEHRRFDTKLRYFADDTARNIVTGLIDKLK